MIQSRTYNNGTILEYFFKVSPESGKTKKTSVFINLATGEKVDPKSVALKIDFASENKFAGICCNIACIDSWITIVNDCWAGEGFSWGV
jgi:hypothetical protein